MQEKKYYTLSTYLRQRYGHRVQKIPLDAGFSCPNRDGTLSRQGCLFCNAHGSGSGLYAQGRDLASQWRLWRDRYLRRLGKARFIAYLQSFSNTHGPISKLREVLEEIVSLPDLAGLAIGTRPDCLDNEKLSLLAAQPLEEIWLELGLQSSNDHILRAINRGHDFRCLQRACELAASKGLRVCVHLIAGLPGEDKLSFLDSVAAVNALPVLGVKFHNLYVCRGSGLAALWRQGYYAPMNRERYVDWLIQGLALLRSDIVVHRVTGDPAPGELLAPDWAADKNALLACIRQAMADRDLWQGKHGDAPDAPRPWYSDSTHAPAPPYPRS